MDRIKIILKETGRWIGILLECFVAFISCYILMAIVGMIIPCGSNSIEDEVTIFIRSNGVHTDICMPTVSEDQNWYDLIAISDYKDTNTYDYVGIGWGDKGFFLDTPTWAELKASTAINAIFLPSPTAMHVELMNRPVSSDLIVEVKISRKKYQLLINFIKGSFKYKNKRTQVILGHGYYDTDNFYEAHGNYHLFNTCNVWTNDALKAAGIRTSIFSVFPDGNLIHLAQ